MNPNPLHRHFGIPLNEWINKVPNELTKDDVGLWQIIPSLRDDFGLRDSDLESAIRKVFELLLGHGAVPTYGEENPDSKQIWLQLQASNVPIIEKLMSYWRSLNRDPNFGDLWFSLHKPQ